MCRHILYSKISTGPGQLKILHSHRFVAVVIQFLIPQVNYQLPFINAKIKLGVGGGGTPYSGLYRYVWPQTVCMFVSGFGQKYGK